jgi:hypothetical protein
MHYVKRVGLKSICETIAAMGIKPPRLRVWRASSMRAIVKNPVYTGRLMYGLRTNAKFYRVGENGARPRTRAELGKFVIAADAEPIVVEGAHASLISDAARAGFLHWERAALERRRTGERLRPRSILDEGPYILSGLIRCVRCGFRFTGSRRTKGEHVWREYTCCGYHGSGAGTCKRFALQQAVFEDFVCREIEHRWFASTSPSRVRTELRNCLHEPRHGRKSETARLRDQVAALNARMLAATANISAEHADVANALVSSLKLERAVLEARIREHEEALDLAADASRLAKDIEATVRDIAKTWALTPREQLKRLVHAFVHSIDVDPSASTLLVRLLRVPRVGLIPTSRPTIRAMPLDEEAVDIVRATVEHHFGRPQLIHRLETAK